jgi:hypothetical protein
MMDDVEAADHQIDTIEAALLDVFLAEAGKWE